MGTQTSDDAVTVITRVFLAGFRNPHYILQHTPVVSDDLDPADHPSYLE